MRFIAATINEFRKNTVGIPVITVLVLSLAMTVLTAWFSQGHFHPDEHFQILEFSHWRSSGRNTPVELAWEFKSRIRPAAQPAYAYLVHVFLEKSGIQNPFFEAFILRLSAGILGWLVSILICLYGFRWIADGKLKNRLFLSSNFIWFLPYVHCRFSAENIGGSLCALGVVSALFALNNQIQNRSRYISGAIVAGVLFGFAFFCRLQMVAALGGFLVWLLLIRKVSGRFLLLLIISFCAALGANLLIDRWFYGAWVLTPFNYLYVNLFQGMADNWGTQPFWFLFVKYLGILIPPYSLLIFLSLAMACIKAWKNPFVWVFVPFVLLHTLVAHKEARFLFGLAYELPLLFMLGWQSLPRDFLRRLALTGKNLFGRLLLRSFIAVNIMLLLIFSCKPAHESIAIYQWLIRRSLHSPVNLYTFGVSPYSLVGLPVYYYRAPNVRLDTLATARQFKALLDTAVSPVYVLITGFSPADSLLSPTIRWSLQKQSIPAWLQQANINNWLARVRVWSIYRCEKESTPR